MSAREAPMKTCPFCQQRFGVAEWTQHDLRKCKLERRAKRKENEAMAKSRKPKSEGADPAPGSPEDLGYGALKKGDLKPDEQREVQRLARRIAEAKRDIGRAMEARKAASEPLTEAKARLAELLDQLDAVESGIWQPGMFSEDGE